MGSRKAGNDAATEAPERSLGLARFHGVNTRQLNVKGRQLIIRFALLLRTASIHDVHNEALQSSLDFFLQAANDLLKLLSPVVLQGDQDQIYINDFRIRGDATVYNNIRLLVAEFNRRGTGGVTFHSELTRVDVLRFLEVIKEHQPQSKPDREGYRKLNQALASADVKAISCNRHLELGAAGELSRYGTYNRRKAALKTYAKILVAMKRVVTKGVELKPVERLKLVKNVQTLIDLCYDDELFFSGLNSLKCEGDYSYFHPVHVAMIAILMGKHLGFTKKDLMDLALAALYYDVGRIKLGPVRLEKPQTLTAEEWDAVRRHPLRSAREVLRGGHLNRSLRRRLLVAFEHHQWVHEGGYPQSIRFREPHIFSRIVAIADTYDALTTSRPHRDGYLPTEALRIMLDDAGKKYDPTLLRVLVNILQVYPMGTMVLLDTREIASVYHNHSDPELHLRPIVRILTDGKGQPITPAIADLSETDDSGDHPRSIVRTLEPDEVNAYVSGDLANR